MMYAFKSVFTLCLAFICYVLVTQIEQFSIDTSLKDLAPQFANNPETRVAIDHVSASLEKRFILLIESTEGSKQVDNSATDFLATNIDQLDHVQITPNTEQVLERLISFYKPYRFHLLSKEQRLSLSSNTDSVKALQTTIAENSHQQLYQLASKPRLIPFEDDPLGWQSEYLFSQLPLLSKNDNQTEDNIDKNNYLVFSLSDEKLSLEAQQNLYTEIQHLIKTASDKFSIKVYRSGIFFFAIEAASQSKKEISFISSISMVTVFFLLLFVFRNIGPIVLPFISIALGVAFAMAVTQMVFNGIHVLTIVFGASLIGVVIDYSLHFFYHQSGHSQRNNRHLLNALTLSLATSLIGYAALSFSNLDALKKVALFSCCGLFMAWLSVVCLGNWMTRNMQAPRERYLQAIVVNICKPLNALNTKTAIFLWLFIILSSAGIALLSAPVSDDPRLFFKPSKQLLSEETFVSQQVNDFEPGRYLLLKSRNDRPLHSIANEFKQIIVQTPELEPAEFVSLIDWVPSFEQQQQNYQLQTPLYQANGAVEQLLTKLGVDQSSVLKLRQEHADAKNLELDLATTANAFDGILPPLWLRYEHKELAFMLIRKGTNTNSLEAIANQIDGLEYINTLAATTTILKEQRQSASLLLLFAYTLVALLLVLRFKSLSAIWMVSIPLASTGLLLILFFITGNTLNLFHVMALFLVLGLGMDYSIFVKEMRENISITHQSIFLSAVTSLLSFGLLAISSIPVVSAFGITLLIGNLSNLIGAFIYSEQLLRYEH